MNIIESIILEKKYLSSLHNKEKDLREEQEMIMKDIKIQEKELNLKKKMRYELDSEIKHYNNVLKIIRFNTIIKFVIAVILTIIVLKIVPGIYANLFQNIILLPLYFTLAYRWVKGVDKELEFKNGFDIVLKKIELDNLDSRERRLEESIEKMQVRLKNVTKSLNTLKEESKLHNIYLNKLKDILENYTLNTLTNYLGEDMVEKITYPKLDLELKKESSI